MLLVPGLIALRIHWYGREINRKSYKYLVCDYLIYSFLIVLCSYVVMWETNPYRIVSFSLQSMTDLQSLQSIMVYSHIYTAGFVVKYSCFALASSVGLSLVYRCGKKLFDCGKKLFGYLQESLNVTDAPNTERETGQKKNFEDKPLI
jgi:hypothetical protein